MPNQVRFKNFAVVASAAGSVMRAATAALAICLCTLPAALAAEPPAKKMVPLEDFFKNRQFGGAVLSPDGKNLAVTTSIKGRRYLAVVDVATRAVTQVGGFPDYDVWNFNWISNDRLVFNVIDREADWSNQTDGMFAVNRDGTAFKTLMSTIRVQMDRAAAFRGLRYLGSFEDGSNNILAEEWNSFDDGVKAVVVNTITGNRRELLLSVKGSVKDFTPDENPNVRIVETNSDELDSHLVWYREDTSQAWKKLAVVNRLKPEFRVIGFDGDGKTMYVSSHKDGDKLAIYKYDFSQNKLGDLVASDPEVDVGGGLVYTRPGNKVIGVRIQGDQARTQWFDEAYQKAQDTVDATFPDQINTLQGNIETGLLVHSYSDVNPGKYHLYYPKNKKMEFLFASTPWIKPEQMSSKLLFHYAARDGLDIPSYLTYPKGRPVKALPLVVLPHGGPWYRDGWNFEPEVQFLASRGYAVLQPQFRGSTGYGWKHFSKGWKNWGLAMQDDITDGVNNLVKQGAVDPARVCIMGASYGGYATVMGLVKDPEQYKCGINLLGVTDINLLLSYAQNHSLEPDLVKFGLKELIGDAAKLQVQFDATSPLKQAARITAPLLMIYGEKDKTVPIEHGKKMLAALKKSEKKDIEWMELEKEEHGIAKEENRFKVYGAIEKFLTRHNPAG